MEKQADGSSDASYVLAIIFIVVAAWLLVSAIVVGCCVSAAQGDGRFSGRAVASPRTRAERRWGAEKAPTGRMRPVA